MKPVKKLENLKGKLFAGNLHSSKDNINIIGGHLTSVGSSSTRDSDSSGTPVLK